MALYNGRRIRAEIAGSGAIGRCPWTDLKVRAHVGAIRQYWAYEGGAPRFERGYEPESDWHLSWKALVRDDCCEVVFGENREHRADILGAEDSVIEIQRSVIDVRDSRERVDFYRSQTGRRVVWVVDIREFWLKRFSLGRRDEKGNYKVEWKPRRTWLWELAATPHTNLYLEFNHRNDKLLHAWVHGRELYAKYVSKRDFFIRYMDAVALPGYRGFSDAALALLTDPGR